MQLETPKGRNVPPVTVWASLVITGLEEFLGRKDDGYPGAPPSAVGWSDFSTWPRATDSHAIIQ